MVVVTEDILTGDAALVAQLRRAARGRQSRESAYPDAIPLAGLLLDAADAIDRLRSEVAS